MKRNPITEMISKRFLSCSLYAFLCPAVLAALSVVTSCTSKTDGAESPKCQTTATVKDLTGLDGCRYVLELQDGTRLEPVLDEAGQEPSVKGVLLRDGMKVTLTYTEAKDRLSACMAGKIVEVTCFSEAGGVDRE
jgi:hypothetical protein